MPFLLVMIGVVLVVLKLAGVVAWSWWLVLIPFFAFGGFFLAILLWFAFLFVCAFIGVLLGFGD